jgi:tRNA splicing endonuclease
MANHKPKKVFGINVKRGQFLTGRKSLAAALKQTEGAVYKRLKWLQKNNVIELKSNNKNTIVTICNYEEYQSKVTTEEQQGNNKVTTKEQQGNTNNNVNNVNNVNNDNNEKNKRVRTIFQKPTIEELKNYIAEKKYSVNAQKFYHHYESNGWMVGKNKMKKWKSAVVKWENSDSNKSNKPNNNYGYQDLKPEDFTSQLNMDLSNG